MDANKIRSALADMIAERDPTLKRADSISEVPCIPTEGSISWEDWLKGRRFRREMSKRVAPGVIRGKSSSKPRRLKRLFKGERGLPFTPTEKL